jgi:hypothetical protein
MTLMMSPSLFLGLSMRSTNNPPAPVAPAAAAAINGELNNALGQIFPEESIDVRQEIHDSYVKSRRERRENHSDAYLPSGPNARRDDRGDAYLLRGRKASRSRSREKTSPTKKVAAVEQEPPKKVAAIEQEPPKVAAIEQVQVSPEPPKKRKASRRIKNAKALVIHKPESDDEEAPKKAKSHDRKPMDEK